MYFSRATRLPVCSLGLGVDQGINFTFADQLKIFYCSHKECLTVVIQLDTVAVQIRYLKQTAVRTDYGEMCRPRSA